MTSCWSKGRNTRYAYYFCDQKGCPDHRKSIRREKVESEFETILRTAQPAPSIFYYALEAMRELWEDRRSKLKNNEAVLKADLALIERKSGQLMERIIGAESPALISVYEGQIVKLEEQKIVLSEKMRACGRPLASFDETFRTALTFLINPCKLWDSGHIERADWCSDWCFQGNYPTTGMRAFEPPNYLYHSRC